MAINHRASAISIAIITIIFTVISIINSVKYNESEFRKAVVKYADDTQNAHLRDNAESLAKFLSISQKLGIGLGVALVIASCLLFGVCQQYMKDNKDRKFLLLPFIVVNVIGCVIQVALSIVIATKFSGATTLVTMILVFIVIDILIRILFTTLMAFYYRFLVRYQGY